VHPTALAVEAMALVEQGVPNPLGSVIADPRCRVITPYHQAVNRLRELARGDGRHGSCGVGVGETVADSLAVPGDTITLAALRDRVEARRRLVRVRDRKRAESRALSGGAAAAPAWQEERAVLDDDGILDAWLESACAIVAAISVLDAGSLPPDLRDGDIVFEGAQGVLLDHAHGFPPHTTWSDCTLRGADDVLDAWQFDGARRRIGVLRSYQVRHGEGPLPTETRALDALEEPHNGPGPWQGRFRRGWLDVELLRRATAAVGRLDVLALTHLDALALDTSWRVATAHGLTDLPGAPTAREAEVVRLIEEATNVPIAITSHGARASHLSRR